MSDNNFDIIVIGGGATGLGVAVDAQARGYKTLLLEAYDFGKSTSSKSTKLIHGGIRYLADLDFSLVKEGLSERYSFINNAPHLAKMQSYLIPFYSRWDKIKYTLGIKLYDVLSKNKLLKKSFFLNKQETLNPEHMPNLIEKNLIGCGVYYDGQFDDTRMLIALLKTFLHLKGTAFNYHQVIEIIKDSNKKACGVVVHNQLTNTKIKFYAKTIINATGIFTDCILDKDEPSIKHQHVTLAQGTHLVFNKDIFNSKHTLVIPKTSDGRILFVLPWHDKIIVGTTDIQVKIPEIDPKPTNEEVDFILDTFQQYTTRKISYNDIKSKFAGLRPLVKPQHSKKSAKISRKHEIFLSDSSIISIVGGKWTIYRLMGEDTINFAINNKLLPNLGASKTKNLKLFGYTPESIPYPLNVYGSQYKEILKIQEQTQNYEKLHHDLPYYQAEIIYHIRFEMAFTVEDILARRTRAILLDANAAIESASTVAKIIAHEKNYDNNWIISQIQKFTEFATSYLHVI